MKKGYFKKLLATGLAAISMMSIFAAASVTANAATVRYSPDATSIEIPDTVTSIGDYEFKNFKKLETVIIGKNVKEISPTAFIGCPSITRFSVKAGNQYFSVENGIYLTTYSNRGADMKKLIRVATGELYRNGRRHEVPRYIYEIGDYAYESAFSAKNYLNELRIENDVIRVGAHAFEGCQAAKIIMGKNVRFVQDYAFADNDIIESIDLGYNLNYVGSFAFSGCDKLATVNQNNSVMRKGLEPFAGASVKINTEKEIIAFDVNGGSIFAIPDNILFDKHSTLNQLVSANVEPQKTGCVFSCWRDDRGNEYRPNNRLKENKSVLLYAKWEGKAEKPSSGDAAGTYAVAKSTTTKPAFEGASAEVTTVKAPENTGSDKPVKKQETTTSAPAAVQAKTTAAAAEKTSYAVRNTAAEKTESDKSYSTARMTKRNDENTDDRTVIETTTAKETENQVRSTTSAEKDEGGKKLNIFEMIVAFIMSLFGKKG